MRIGIIGTGNIGSTLARLWVDAGHQVFISSRHPEELEELALTLGENATATTPEEAAAHGEVVLLSIPLGQVPHLSSRVRELLAGKIVLDTCNPFVDRDGEPAREIERSGQGTGVWMAHKLPGARLVRAFNTVNFKILRSEADRSGEPIGIPLASDDPRALEVASTLVRDAGFGPVVVGALVRAREFDPGTPPFASNAGPRELERMFGLKQTKAA